MGFRIGDGSWLPSGPLGNGGSPQIGDVRIVGPRDALLAPPKNTFWKKVSGFSGSRIFQLNDLKKHTQNDPMAAFGRPRPLKEGDVIGVREFGLRPHLPEGLFYEALKQPAAPLGSEAADLYVVRSMPMVGAFVTIDPVLPPLRVAKPIPMFPDIPVEVPGKQPWDFPPAIPTGIPVKLPAYAAVGRGGRIFGADLRGNGALMVAGA